MVVQNEKAQPYSQTQTKPRLQLLEQINEEDENQKDNKPNGSSILLQRKPTVIPSSKIKYLQKQTAGKVGEELNQGQN